MTEFTYGIVDAVDPLHVSRHGLDASLLGPHILVEQVIGLEVQHASPLLHVNLVVRGLSPFPEMMPHGLWHVLPV